MNKQKSGTSADFIRRISVLPIAGRMGIAFGSLVVYLIVLSLYGSKLNIGIVPVTFLPVLIWAYFFGRMGGVISGLAIIPFFMGFYKLTGMEQFYLELSNLPYIIYLVYAFWGFVLGDLQETRGRLELELSKQKNTEQALIDKELRFRSLFEHGNDAIFIFDPKYFTVAVNQRAHEWLGYTSPELNNVHASKLVLKEEWGNELSIYASLSAGKEVSLYERTFVKKDGSIIKGEVNIALIANQEGLPSHFQSVVRDVTERARTQEQLRLQAAVLEAAAPGILITDTEGNIIWSNPAFSKLSGYSALEIIGKKPQFLKSGLQDERFHKEMWDTILSGKSWRGRIVNKRKDGELYDAELVITPVISDYGKIVQFVAITQDISLQVKAEKQLEHLALHDPLTDLPNRVLFYERFEQLSAISFRQDQKCAVMFIDLDNFKQVNDLFGHEQGDMLLRNIAGRLMRMMRSSDTVARLGGDEFGIILANVTIEGVKVVATKILETLKQEFMLNGDVVNISASMGISIFPDHGKDLNFLLGLADQAMYKAKEFGKNTYYFYSNDLEGDLNSEKDEIKDNATQLS